MNKYEMLYILNPELSDEAREAVIAKLENIITTAGGTVVSISTTNNPKTPTSSTHKVLNASIENSSEYVFGNYINIKGESLDIVLKLPKSYAEKLSVVVASSDILTGSYTVSVGSYANGSISNLVCSDGQFTATSSQTVTVE